MRGPLTLLTGAAALEEEGHGRLASILLTNGLGHG